MDKLATIRAKKRVERLRHGICGVLREVRIAGLNGAKLDRRVALPTSCVYAAISNAPRVARRQAPAVVVRQSQSRGPKACASFISCHVVHPSLSNLLSLASLSNDWFYMHV